MIKQVITTLMAITVAGCIHFKTNEAKALEVESVCKQFSDAAIADGKANGVTLKQISEQKLRLIWAGVKQAISTGKAKLTYNVDLIHSSFKQQITVSYTFIPKGAPNTSWRTAIYFSLEDGLCYRSWFRYNLEEIASSEL